MSAAWSLLIRLELRMIVGMPKSQAERIEQRQPFDSIDDVRRCGISRATVERLARADVFGSLQLDRRASLWESLRHASTSPLFQDTEDAQLPLSLPAMEGRQEVFADYQATGQSLKALPISFFRTQLDELRVAQASRLASLPDGCFVRVGGLVLVRQRPGTIKGITFVTIEDETGMDVR